MHQEGFCEQTEPILIELGRKGVHWLFYIMVKPGWGTSSHQPASPCLTWVMFLLNGSWVLLTPDSTTAITALGLERGLPGPASLHPSFPTGSLRTGQTQAPHPLLSCKEDWESSQTWEYLTAVGENKVENSPCRSSFRCSTTKEMTVEPEKNNQVVLISFTCFVFLL